MEEKDERNKLKIDELKTFPVPFRLEEIKDNISNINETTNNLSKDQIIKRAFNFHSQGNISEAIKYYQQFINKGFNDHRVYSNYGIILKDNGQLKKAEILTRKAIEINPNFAEAYNNLGLIMKGLSNLKEAELLTLRAIEINPDYVEAHYNLGLILKNIGNFKDAERSQRKAIELNPDLAEAHSNLGNILRHQGNLKEAKSSLNKAIEINSDMAEAYYNLGLVYSDLGESEELNNLAQKILHLSSINSGYKLLTSLQLIIVNLIQKQFIDALINIDNTKELILKGALNLIDNQKNVEYFSTFFKFILALYPLLEKDCKNADSEKIPHIGESHCLSFSHQDLSLFSKVKKIQPVLLIGAKAWHFANNKKNQWKDSLEKQIEKHTYSKHVFISFGEIDCRKDEGILSHAIKEGKDISEVCKKTIKGYLNYMEMALSRKYPIRYYFGIPAPIQETGSLDELDIKRIELIKIYNSILKKEVLSKDCFFLDVYDLTSDINGENNNRYMCDNTHLSPKCLSILFENHLHHPHSP